MLRILSEILTAHGRSPENKFLGFSQQVIMYWKGIHKDNVISGSFYLPQDQVVDLKKQAN